MKILMMIEIRPANIAILLGTQQNRVPDAIDYAMLAARSNERPLPESRKPSLRGMTLLLLQMIQHLGDRP
jgi:hypothetical protein